MEDLIKAALSARKRAYAPYSGFQVGAAVISKNGTVFDGCNIENASYGLTNCAERTAIFKAVAAGERQLAAIAVAADTSAPTAPCGACRQVMVEFGIDKVIMANVKGDKQVASLAQLLPASFTKLDLTGDDTIETRT